MGFTALVDTPTHLVFAKDTRFALFLDFFFLFAPFWPLRPMSPRNDDGSCTHSTLRLVLSGGECSRAVLDQTG